MSKSINVFQCRFYSSLTSSQRNNINNHQSITHYQTLCFAKYENSNIFSPIICTLNTAKTVTPKQTHISPSQSDNTEKGCDLSITITEMTPNTTKSANLNILTTRTSSGRLNTNLRWSVWLTALNSPKTVQALSSELRSKRIIKSNRITSF